MNAAGLRAIGLLLLASVVTAGAGAVGVGDRAPDFTITDAAGRSVSLEALRGKVVCLDFWATWCRPCRTLLPALDAVARRLGGAVEIVAVSIDRDRALADRFLDEHLPAPALRIAYDPGGALLARLGAPGMPALYVIDRRGIVRLVETGFDRAQLDEVAERLAALLAEPDPAGPTPAEPTPAEPAS